MLLGVSVSALQTWRGTARGPEFVKIGSLVKYRRGALTAYIDACTVRSTSEYAQIGSARH